MAHGGSPEWNQAVADAVARLAAEIPTAVAYGMADPRTLAAGLDSLRSVGVGRVAVVRLFLSGRSFLDQTKYFLGLSNAPPATFLLMGRANTGQRPPGPINHGLNVATHEDGLIVSREVRRLVVERARAASHEESEESVLLLAHGMGDEAQNDQVLQAMREIANEVGNVGFATVAVATLREDWPEKRVVSETQVRSFVTQETAAARRVIVVPIRLSGFGPYSEVLEGLEYTPTAGFLPHAAVEDWIRNTASQVLCEAGWPSSITRCAPASS